MNLVLSKSLGKESARFEFVEIAPRISNMLHYYSKVWSRQIRVA
jgi:hypothetical protein